MKSKFFLLIILLTAFVSVYSRGWYVSVNSGQDGWTTLGTISDPYKTLNNARSKLQPGDTLFIREGTYTGNFNPWMPGTTQKPVVITAYKKEKVIFKGGDLNTDAFSAGNGARYNVVQNIEITGPSREGLSLTSSTNNITFKNMIIHDCSWQGIYIDYSGYNITIDSCVVYNNVYENVKHLAKSWRCAVNVEGKNNTVKNTEVYKNHGEGIGLYGDGGNLAIKNILHDNWSTNIYICNTYAARCEGNWIYTENDSNFYRPLYGFNGGPYGIMMANESRSHFLTDCVVVNNIVEGGKANFFYWNGWINWSGLINCTIANNLFKDGLGGCIMVNDAAHSNALFCNNIFYQSNDNQEVVESSSFFGYDSKLTIKNNLYFGARYYEGSQKYGLDPISGNPNFLNNSLTLKRFKVDSLTSPCVEAGIDYPQKSTIDFGGAPRTVGKIDVGPFETFRLLNSIQNPGNEKLITVFSSNTGVIVNSVKQMNVWATVYSLNGSICYRGKMDLKIGNNTLDFKKSVNTTYIVSLRESTYPFKTHNTKIQ